MVLVGGGHGKRLRPLPLNLSEQVLVKEENLSSPFLPYIFSLLVLLSLLTVLGR